MITIEVMQGMLDDIAAEFPEAFFAELNGGIVLLCEAKHHDDDIDGQLYTLGMYHRGGGMGRYISIYYGSFMCVYGHLSPDKFKEKLRSTVRHEFRHNFESLAGDDDLERLDEKNIADYRNGISEDDEDDEGDAVDDDGAYIDENSFCEDEFIEELNGADTDDEKYDGGEGSGKGKKGWWRGL